MTESYFGYRFSLLLLIIAINAFFAAAEIALVSVRRSRLHQMSEQGHAGAQAALSLLARPERLLATIQVGATLASLGAGWAGEDTLYRLLVHWAEPLMGPQTAALLRAVAFAVAFLFLTFAMVVVGEIVPKTLAIEMSDRFAVTAAPVLLFFYRIASPFVAVFARAAAAVSRLLARRPVHTAVHSSEELKLIAGTIREAGQLSKLAEDSIDRVLDLPSISVREIMVPRNDVVSVPVDASLDQVLRTMAENTHSRVPVFDTTPDHIIGYLHYKDLLSVWQRHRIAARMQTPAPAFRLRSLLRKSVVVPESKPLDQTIDEFRQGHNHMSMVVDEFGTIVGLVTLEDVLEQVFGEIEDEFDVNRPRPALEAPELELEGTTSIRDLETQYGVELPVNAGFETLAGYLLFRLGYIPKPGETLEEEGRRFTILDMDHNRIARVRIERLT